MLEKRLVVRLAAQKLTQRLVRIAREARFQDASTVALAEIEIKRIGKEAEHVAAEHFGPHVAIVAGLVATHQMTKRGQRMTIRSFNAGELRRGRKD